MISEEELDVLVLQTVKKFLSYNNPPTFSLVEKFVFIKRPEIEGTARVRSSIWRLIRAKVLSFDLVKISLGPKQ